MNRVKNELMLPLDDLSKIISAGLIRHLRKLGVPNWEIRKLVTTSMAEPTTPFVSKLDLLVRLFQFKIGIRTREALYEF